MTSSALNLFGDRWQRCGDVVLDATAKAISGQARLGHGLIESGAMDGFVSFAPIALAGTVFAQAFGATILLVSVGSFNLGAGLLVRIVVKSAAGVQFDGRVRVLSVDGKAGRIAVQDVPVALATGSAVTLSALTTASWSDLLVQAPGP